MCAQSAPGSDTLRIVNWNIEWFGNGIQHDPSVQTAGVRTVLSGLGADVYALCEVVSADSLAAVVDDLPGEYDFVLSPYGSLADGPADPDYAGAQKLALVYRTSSVRVTGSRALMQGSSDAYYNFASGRFPFLVNAEVRGRDGGWRSVQFLVLHAKAMSDYTSCQRRRWGALQMKDTLDRYFSNLALIILGDYNDDLDASICSGDAPTAYAAFVSDSTDANHYRAVTLPLSRTGVSSINGYSSLIDHVIVSNEVAGAYVSGSARVLREEVESIVPDFEDAVSNHYPVLSKYVMDGGTLTNPAVRPAIDVQHPQIFPNPASDRVWLRWAGARQAILAYTVCNAAGAVLLEGAVRGTGSSIGLEGLAPGLYFLRVADGTGTRTTLPLSITR